MIRLVTFGDSWPFGEELCPPHKPFGYLLADLLQVDSYSNMSVSGSAADHMILQLEQYLQINKNTSADRTIAVFFITDMARMSMIEFDNKVETIRPGPTMDRSVDEKAYCFAKHFHTPQQERFRLLITLACLQAICNRYNIEDYYINGWNRCDFDFVGLDISKIYLQGKVSCADLFGASGLHEFTVDTANKFVWPNICHPNHLGHELIANTLYQWITDDKSTPR